jgi:DNA polymerase elongation subunit (family B)
MQNLVVLDCEVYPNYTLFAFKNIDNQKIITVEIKGSDSSLNDESYRKLNTIMKKRMTFGFNSRNYDIPVILFALKRKTAKEIHKLSDYIIENNSPSWMTLNKFDLVWSTSEIKHFDIQEPAPGVKVSLKLYGARLNSHTLQDLPIEPGTMLNDNEMENVKQYCINDLNTTIDLFNHIKDRMKLRFDMSKQYTQDLLSKSDAQIAEVVIKSELSKKFPGRRLYAPKIPDSAKFKYLAPSFIKFQTPQLKEIFKSINETTFQLDAKGSIKLPADLKKTKIKLGKSTYQLGIGGIHSTEKKQCVIPSKDQILVDKDVASYYPSIILNLELYPKHLGTSFLDIYRNIVEERLKAKKEGNKVVNESLKIVINGSFGKLGSKYSALYSPDLMITVTLTGQLALLMLIEKLELNGISVISSNTDGFVSLMHKDQYKTYDDICFDWELNTGFDLEETRYKALYSRDVNNYLAVTEKGAKGKGIFTIDSIGKNPQAPICINSVIDLFTKNIPIEKTIRECKDLTQFLTVRSVTGGAVFRNEYLGRVVRWIYSTNGEAIKYKKNGNKVAKSDGARPIMTLDNFPTDIDYARYINEATDILDDLGFADLQKFLKCSLQ